MRVLLISFMMSSAVGWADSRSDFQVFSGLRGAWTISLNGKVLPFEMVYQVESRGSIVTEHFGKELAVIYRDGERLLMTHFCNMGNQPRLELQESAIPNTFEFKLLDITGLESPSDPHVTKAIYKLIDSDHVEATWVWDTPTGQQIERYLLSRKS